VARAEIELGRAAASSIFCPSRQRVARYPVRMLQTRFTVPALAIGLALTTGVAPAQVKKGDRAPEFEIQAAFNGGPASYFEMKGQAVMMEIFATW
jgi:hypothetical protein